MAQQCQVTSTSSSMRGIPDVGVHRGAVTLEVATSTLCQKRKAVVSGVSTIAQRALCSPPPVAAESAIRLSLFRLPQCCTAAASRRRTRRRTHLLRWAKWTWGACLVCDMAAKVETAPALGCECNFVLIGLAAAVWMAAVSWTEAL
jgi:hypothetical protein